MAEAYDPDDAYAWRRPRRVIDLERFDIPLLHQRSGFDASRIRALADHRMAGCPIRMTPDAIREAIRTGRFNEDATTYLHELITQFDAYDIRVFQAHCGITRYELARAMIACDIRQPLLAEWMNCHAPGYQSTLEHHRTWDLSPRI